MLLRWHWFPLWAKCTSHILPSANPTPCRRRRSASSRRWHGRLKVQLAVRPRSHPNRSAQAADHRADAGADGEPEPESLALAFDANLEVRSGCTQEAA